MPKRMNEDLQSNLVGVGDDPEHGGTFNGSVWAKKLLKKEQS